MAHAKWPSVSRSNLRKPLSKDRPRGDYLPVLRGSLIGTCPEVLSTRGHPSGLVRLISTSKTRKNFSASMHRLRVSGKRNAALAEYDR